VFGACILYFVLGIDPIAFLSEVPLCAIRFITDVTCPGCGMTRAMLSLGKMDFQGAYLYHPLSFPLFAIATLYAIRGSVPFARYHRLGVGIGVVLVLCVWVLRLN